MWRAYKPVLQMFLAPSQGTFTKQLYILYWAYKRVVLRTKKEFNKFVDPYDSMGLKLDTIGVYWIEIISSAVMIAFVVYETKGLAGHYRTLIN